MCEETGQCPVGFLHNPSFLGVSWILHMWFPFIAEGDVHMPGSNVFP